MLSKSNVYESLKALPDNFTIDELLEHLIFVQKVEEGLKDYLEGKEHLLQTKSGKSSKNGFDHMVRKSNKRP